MPEHQPTADGSPADAPGRRPWWAVVPTTVAGVATVVVVVVAAVRLATAEAGDGPVCVTCRDTEAVGWPVMAAVVLLWAIAVAVTRLGQARPTRR